jgi:hypothetical protein
MKNLKKDDDDDDDEPPNSISWWPWTIAATGFASLFVISYYWKQKK